MNKKSLTPALAGRWADVVTLPAPTIRSRIAKQLFEKAIQRIELKVSYPGGQLRGSKSRSAPIMELSNPEAFYRRLGATGTIGFGESYMAGDWDAEDLAGVIGAFASSMDTLINPSLHFMRDKVLNLMPSAHRNTVAGAKENIHSHYDLSNELFTLFLDPTLTYSSGYFSGKALGTAESLEEAQVAKMEHLLDSCNVGEGTELLEIGTGWGSLAIRAAERGAKVTTVTLSEEQALLARERIAAAGHTENITVLLQDYRDIEGTFDAVVSVEMVEAVGEEFWPTYFLKLDHVLRPGGSAGIQAILQSDYTMRATSKSYTWIRKYIFPGGHLLSREAIGRVVTGYTALAITEVTTFGLSYGETLRQWRENFESHKEEVTELGFDEIFQRMWTFYLAYCEAGFATGYLDVGQFILRK